MPHALRTLLRTPGFTLVALLTLALGIGANTTAFSVLNALLLHTPPYREPETIVRIARTTQNGMSSHHAVANYLDYRERNTVFSELAIHRSIDLNVGEPGQAADRLRGLAVSANFFPLLGTAPLLGRTFTAEEEQPGANNVVILSHATWLTRFGGDRAAVGRTLRVDGETVTIVGVMPASFSDPLLWGEAAAFRPLAFNNAQRAERDNTGHSLIARLKPGVTFAQAQSEMDTIAAQLAKAYPANNLNRGLRLSLLGDSDDNAGNNVTWLVAGLAAFVLLIACANLANLQFARNLARGREHAIRAALGASRGRLMRLVLAESLLLSLAGGALGLVLALWTNELVGSTFDFAGSAGLEIPLNQRVLAFTFAVSVLTGIGFGLLPAWLAARVNVGDALKQGSRGSTASRSQNRVRQALIVAEVALALVLLAGAGFFYRGLQRITHRDAGWRAENLVNAYISLRGSNYSQVSARENFYTRLHERLAALPGVQSVGIGTSLPTFGYNIGNSFVVENAPPPEPGRNPTARVTAVLPGYLDTLGIRLLQGRDFTDDDGPNKPAVVLINETMARKLWPGQNPIGKRIGGATPFMSNPREVIGVVSDIRPIGNLLNIEGSFQFYRALRQWNQNFATIALRLAPTKPGSDTPAIAAEAIARDLRRVVTEIDPDQAIYEIGTVRQEAARALGSVDAAATALVCFAILGVLLAAVGIYGVIAHSVVQRTNEFGIRLALGAHARDILTLVLKQGLRLSALGLVLGIAGTFGLFPILRTISPDFARNDPVLTALVAAFLLLVAAFACYLPARRATKVDPMTALRAE